MHSYPVTAGEISRAKFYLKPLQKPVSGKKYSWTIVRNMLKWSEILQREGFCFNSWLLDKIFGILQVHYIFFTFTKKVLRVERADMRKLVVAICLLNVAVPMHDESRKGEANRKRKLYSKQLWSVDWVLSRAEWVPAEGSWTCLRHWKAILAEDKRCSCPSSWGHSKNHLTFQSSRDCKQH